MQGFKNWSVFLVSETAIVATSELDCVGKLSYPIWCLCEKNLHKCIWLNSFYQANNTIFFLFFVPSSCWQWLENSLITEMKYAELLWMSEVGRKKLLFGLRTLQMKLLRWHSFLFIYSVSFCFVSVFSLYLLLCCGWEVGRFKLSNLGIRPV